ncbi:MAG: hypothetical protein ACREH3_02805 [Geminicoccales bacterium]
MGTEPNNEHALRGDAPGAALLAALRSALAGIRDHGAALPIALLMAVAVTSRLAYTVDHDVAWYIYTAGVLLDGGRLYEDAFFEMNPPLMVYLTVPGVILARLTGLFPVHAYVLTVFAAIAFSLWLGARVLPVRSRYAVLVLWFLVLAVLPAGGFGQRPHLMVCFALPYLLLVAGRLHSEKAPCGTALAVAVGAVAGVGFAIKPYFLLVPAALEVLLLWRTRRRVALVRPETLALGIVVASYAAAIAIFTPGYLTRAVPYALEVYDAYHTSLRSVLTKRQAFLLPLLILVHCRTRRALAPAQAAVGDVFSVSAAALFVVYLMQMKGWSHHLYPTTAMLAMLSGTIAMAASAAFPLRMVVLATGLAFVVQAAVTSDIRFPVMDRLMPYVRQHAEGGSIYFFSSHVRAGFPMTVYADVEWASRFPALWLLPGIARSRHAAARDADTELLAEIERFTTDAVIADLSASLPELVFVDVRPRKRWYGDIDFDFIAHFSADPRFAAVWARYERIGGEQGFEIYRRRSDPMP